MRPRAIQTVPGLDPNASPFERFKEFARRIISVPKEEADKVNGIPTKAKRIPSDRILGTRRRKV